MLRWPLSSDEHHQLIPSRRDWNVCKQRYRLYHYSRQTIIMASVFFRLKHSWTMVLATALWWWARLQTALLTFSSYREIDWIRWHVKLNKRMIEPRNKNGSLKKSLLMRARSRTKMAQRQSSSSTFDIYERCRLHSRNWQVVSAPARSFFR